MVQGKKLKQKPSLTDNDQGADEGYGCLPRDFELLSPDKYPWETSPVNPDPGPRNEPASGGDAGGGPLPGGEGETTVGPSEEELWYVICQEVGHQRTLKEVKLRPGMRITFGPMATGGRFPACWRVYDGKGKDAPLVLVFSGVVWFYRRDFHVRDYVETKA